MTTETHRFKCANGHEWLAEGEVLLPGDIAGGWDYYDEDADICPWCGLEGEDQDA